jgi:hypothetical protein
MKNNITELIRTKRTVTIQMMEAVKESSHTGILIADLGTLLHLQGTDGHGWYIPREKIADILPQAGPA